MKKLKVIFVGQNAVGKTSIANRYTRNLFSNRYINTIGCDFYIKHVDIGDGEEYKLIIHDIGGQLEFRDFRRKYMDNADIVLIVFALNDPSSYDISEYLDDIAAMPSKPLFAIVGNKLDLVSKDKLDLSIINAIAQKNGVPVYLASAKENIMIQEMIMDLVKKFIEKGDRLQG
nr:GTP-binding protein [Candidatus Sigynarchaeota archaeon]